MPIVDGLASTKMIRSHEKAHSINILSKRAQLNRRIPVFALSASLIEANRHLYIDAGFDGWILKPVDFQRLSVLLSGIMERETRQSCLYEPGEWERGGWFTRCQPDMYHTAIESSSTDSPAEVSTKPTTDIGDDPFCDAIHG